MAADSPDPRYYKDGNGLHPTWRLRLRHPIFALRFTPLNRLRVRWNDRHYRKRPVVVIYEAQRERVDAQDREPDGRDVDA